MSSKYPGHFIWLSSPSPPPFSIHMPQDKCEPQKCQNSTENLIGLGGGEGFCMKGLVKVFFDHLQLRQTLLIDREKQHSGEELLFCVRPCRMDQSSSATDIMSTARSDFCRVDFQGSIYTLTSIILLSLSW